MNRKAIALLYAVTIAGYPLVSGIPLLIGVDSRLVSVPFRGLSLLLALMVIALAYRQRRLYRGSAWLPVLVFWLFYSIRIAADTVFDPIQLGLSGPEYVLFAFGTCLIPLVAFFQDPGEETLRLAAKYSFWFCIAASSIALFITYRELSLGTSDAYVSGRIGFETLNPVSLGYLGVNLALFGVYYFPDQRWYSRIALAFLIAVGLFIAGASGSRGPVVAFAAAILFRFVAVSRKMPARKLGVRIAAIVFFGLILIQGAFLIEQTFGFRIVSRFQSGSQFSSLSSQEHLNLAADAQHEFLEHPLFGSALEETNSHEYPHNVALESFMAIGVFGGFVFCSFLVWALLAGFPLARSPAHSWVALLLVEQVVAALTAGALSLSSGMWCLCAAAIGIAANQRRVGQMIESPLALNVVLRPVEMPEPIR